MHVRMKCSLFIWFVLFMYSEYEIKIELYIVAIGVRCCCRMPGEAIWQENEYHMHFLYYC